MHRIAGLFWRRSSLAGKGPRARWRAAAVIVALALSALPGAVPALAKAQQVAVTGTDQRFFGAPARVWFAGPWTQVRGLPQTGTFAFSGSGVTLSGTESDIANGTLDAFGNGHVWASVNFTDTATGVTCSGIAQGMLINALATNSVVAPCTNGALLKGTLQDTEVFPPNQAPPTWVKSDFTGVLLIPG